MKEKKIKHIEHFNKKKLDVLGFISFLFGFSQALLIYVLSDYFKEAFGNDNVSIFYFISYVIALIGLLNMYKLIKWLGKTTVLFLLFFLQVCFVTFLIFIEPSVAGAILLMMYIIFSYLSWVTLDIILEDYSEDRKSGRIRGLHLTILNAGFIFGPFLSTQLLQKYGFDGLFFVSMLINMFMFLVGLVGLRDVNYKFVQNLTIRDLMKKIFVNADLMKIYFISLALEFFYALMIVYTPLYLLNLGMSWSKIGVAFTVMLVPFVILEYPVGFFADKKFGEKEMLIGGLLIMAISTGSIYFISGTSVFVWSLILLITRAGAALIEILRDSYFYKKIDGRDVDIISFFRTTRSVAYILATAISAFTLLVFSVKSIFLIVSLSGFLALIAAVKLVDNKCEVELKKHKKYA